MKLSKQITISPIGDYLDELHSQKRLIHRGSHTYQKGTEFLVSNEFDWFNSNFNPVETEAVIGFGTNSLWDISVRDQAKAMVIADWSPWPLIAHAFIFSPLLRVSNPPEEFIFMISGLPLKYSHGESLSDVFDFAKKFTLSKIDDSKLKVLELLNEHSANPSITEFELILTTFFRPRLGDSLHQQNGYGPFYELKNQNTANLTFYLEQRYNPKNIGRTHSTLSSRENFNYLKSLFQTDSVYHALADVMDINFYQTRPKALR